MQTRTVIRFSLTGALMLNFIGAFTFNQTLMASQGFQETADRAPAVEASNELHYDDVAIDPGSQIMGKDQMVSAQSAAIQVNGENENLVVADKSEKSEVAREQAKDVVEHLDHFQIRADAR